MKYRILTVDEYEKYKYMLPNPARRFWVYREGEQKDTRCSFVNEEGMIDRFGTFCSDTTLWMRPVIEYDPGEEREIVFKEGQQVLLHGLEWTAVSEDILVSDRCVEQVKFDDSSLSFDNSYLKYAIYQYFKRRVSVEDVTDKKEEVQESDTIGDEEFSYSFLANLICIFIAAASGVVCTISFSPLSVIMFAIAVGLSAVIMGSYNVKKIKEGIRKAKRNTMKGPALLKSTEAGQAEIEKDSLKLFADNIKDSQIKEKTDEINKLIEGLMKTGNRTAEAKVKFFYLPETQKTLELYHKLSENGIDTPNSKECKDIIFENLEKTIRLLTMEYDKAVSESLLDARISQGVIGKMLDNAETEAKTRLEVK